MEKEYNQETNYKTRLFQLLLCVISTLAFSCLLLVISSYYNGSTTAHTKITAPLQERLHSNTFNPANMTNININNKTSNTKQRMSILIVSRRRSGSTWTFDILSSLCRRFFDKNTLSLFEADHITTLDTYNQFIQEKDNLLNNKYNHRPTKQDSQKFQGNKEKRQTNKRWYWDHLEIDDRNRLTAGIISSLFSCQYVDNFSGKIGAHHPQLCHKNGFDSGCSLENLQKRCEKSKVILLKSIFFDYGEIFYIEKINPVLFKTLKFVMIIRNPWDQIESQIGAGMQFTVHGGINEVCNDYYFNTVVPFLNTYIDYNGKLNGEKTVMKLKNNYNYNYNISSISSNGKDNEGDKKDKKLFVLQYETIKDKFKYITKLLSHFFVDGEYYYFDENLFDESLLSKIEKQDKEFLSSINKWSDEYLNQHSPHDCNQQQNHVPTTIRRVVRCDNQQDKQRKNKDQHKGIRNQRDFHGKSSLTGCEEYMSQFDYTIPHEMLTRLLLLMNQYG